MPRRPFRRYRRRRVVRRRRRVMRRRTRVTRRPSSREVHRFVRVATGNQVAVRNFSDEPGAASATIDASGFLSLTSDAAISQNWFGVGLAFSIGDVPAYASELSPLFDRYRLSGIKVMLIPHFATVAVDDAGTIGVDAILHSVIDLDDDAAPSASVTGLQGLMQYPSFRSQSMNGVSNRGRAFQRFFRPRVLGAIANTAAAVVSATSRKAPVLDAASPDIPHYGMKLLIEVQNPTANATTLNFRMMVKYYFTMYAVR